MRIFSTILFTVLFTSLAWTQAVFINEINHNDPVIGNRGVELAGPSGTSLNGWKLELYDLDGFLYHTADLSGVTFQPAPGNMDQIWFPIAQLRSSTQNAGGVALVDNLFSILHFISYGKVVTALDGDATGSVSTLMGLLDPILGSTFQLIGTGKLLPAFIWTTNISSPGALNANQFFPITLPLEMVDFSTYVTGSDIRVEWSTSYEENLSLFRLEHSFNGIDFTRINDISAVNSGQMTHYNYRHKDLPMGSHYYRIVSINNEGEEAMTTETIVAKITRKNDISANPNPATDHITVLLSMGQSQATVDVYDITGKLMLSTTVFDGGQIDVSNFVPGKYILQLNDGSTLKVIQIMKR